VNRLGGITARTALLGVVALIVVGGIALALVSNSSLGLYGSFTGPASFSSAGASANQVIGLNPSLGSLYSSNAGNASDVQPGYTQVVGQTTALSTTTTVGPSQSGRAPSNGPGTNVTQGSPTGAGGLIEFSTDLDLRSSAPEQAASGVVALAYSVGGYVAYESTYSNSAYVVVRVPAAQYQQVLGKVEAMGTVIRLTSNSNDVRVQYTDLNATLASLRTEQNALLKLLNQATTIDSTLAIQTQLQGVNKQVNDIESQILQTKTLIDYATINVTITETAQLTLLSMNLSATPKNGTAPLSVTFNAIVKGGAQPYVVLYNFGDGYASQGQIVIHTYYQAGIYKVLVSATDLNGTVVQATASVKVVAAPSQSGIENFFGVVSNLFLSVVEGIVEVAVVVLPIAAVGAVIIIPIQRHNRSHRDVRQSQ
jgi:hypothetical protein